MFHRKPRRFRYRSNGRGHQRHANGDGQMRITPNAFSNNERRNNEKSSLLWEGRRLWGVAIMEY